MADTTPPAGWYLDPTGQGLSRFWNGVSWTQLVDRGGSVANAPIDPVLAQTPPGPGTQVTAPVAPQPPRPAPQPTMSSHSDHSVLGVIFGVMAVFFVFLMVFAIVSDDSSDEPPTINVVTPATTVAPAPETPAPAPAPAPASTAPIEPADTAGG